MSTHLSADQLLARVKSLPPLPQAVFELQEALRNGSSQAERIVNAVSRDQALTITALRLANSPFYGVSGRVVTLRDAVQILGLNTLAAAVTTAAVMASFDRNACTGFDFDACWRHSIATALCAQMLAGLRGMDANTAYTVGLLHDVGRLALATHFPKQLAATLVWADEHDVPTIEAERELLGTDHALVGGMVATHWRLAPEIASAIRLHHDVPSAEARSLLDALHVADNITHALDLSHSNDEMVPSLSLAAWERMSLSNTELHPLFERVEGRMRDFGPALA